MENEIKIFENQNVKLEVNMKDETVWLSLDQMSKLFDRDKSVISRHIKNAIAEECDNVVVAKFATTTKHGSIEGKTQTHMIDCYNLDVIISVGYRVKSSQGVAFRKWANQVLKDYMIKGYVVNQKRLEYLEKTIKLIDIATRADDNLNGDEAKDILNKLSNSYKIESTEKKNKNKASKPPYTTSTMQQDAVNKINFSSKKTMSVAQKLYEGINIGSETVGLITYMRTDSIRLSDEFVGNTLKYIEVNYGKEYVGFVKKSKKTENVQDAHEAIRPTSITRTPDSVKEYLTNDEYKLYRLIYFRALASLMKDAKQQLTTVILDNNDYKFKVNGSVITFDGYLKVYSEFEKSEDKILPDLDKYKSDNLITDKVETKQHFTEPPARYTESSLIKEMESLGIGRPSTYATTISTIIDRGYVNKKDKKFVPTEIGIETTNKLQEFFKDLINVKYTAKMEEDLDNIAGGTVVWNELLKKFWEDFEPMVKDAFDNMEKKEPEKTGEVCPECGKDLVKKNGRYGEFIACSNYPECKYIKKEEKKVVEVCDCIKCGNKIVERKTKKGKVFYGCSNFPKCKEAYWDMPTGKKCPECNSMLVTKDGKVKCSACDYKEE